MAAHTEHAVVYQLTQSNTEFYMTKITIYTTKQLNKKLQYTSDIACVVAHIHTPNFLSVLDYDD